MNSISNAVLKENLGDSCYRPKYDKKAKCWCVADTDLEAIGFDAVIASAIPEGMDWHTGLTELVPANRLLVKNVEAWAKRKRD